MSARTPKPGNDEGDIRLQLVAYLMSENWEQTRIARRLNLSEARISTLVTEARKRSLLVDHPEFHGDKELVLEQLSQLTQTGVEKALMPALRDRSPKLEVVHIVPEEGPAPHSQEDFGDLVAPIVQRYLQQALKQADSKNAHCRIGVGWGSTVHATIEAMNRRGFRKETADPSKYVVFPVCASPVALKPKFSEYTSTLMAQRLSEILSRHPNPVPSLIGIPAILPQALAAHSAREFFLKLEDYRAIFDAKGHAENVAECGLLLAGIGAEEGLRDVFSKAMLGNNAKILDEVLLGELVGVPLQRPEAPEPMRAAQVELSACWTGLLLEQLRGARTLVVARGREKARVVLEALGQQLISLLIIDHSLGAEIGRCLGLTSSPPPRA